MKKIMSVAAVVVLLAACGKKSADKKNFIISGTITNAPVAKLYLEQVPMANMQPQVVDSATVGKDGKYSLSVQTGEAMVYNLRFDQAQYPVASVINDAPSITLNAVFSKENAQFPDSYEVKGSASSQVMKDFMMTFNKQLQVMFENEQKADSLRQSGAPDSVWQSMLPLTEKTSVELRVLLDSALASSQNPALTMILLGYYQGTANNMGGRLQALTKDELFQVVSAAAAKYPAHQGLASIKTALEGWVGKMAPEIALPDPDGKEVRLTSLRGKYVLVDFWASWCAPCRAENPNVVAAFNKYKSKNFTVFGVSLDRPGQKDKWVKAIMEDKLTWPHVSDLKFWQSAVVPLYKFDGIPYNVLVDPTGKIIAENLRGEALERKLAEVLK